MENQVRIFRKNPIAWWSKDVMRYLRKKYGQDKKSFLMLRSIYLALCEIESDFVNTPINSFTKTVGTYAGVSREVTGKYINILVQEKLITRTQLKNPKTHSFTAGTVIELLDFQLDVTSSEPLSGYPSSGLSQHRDTQAPIKKINTDKKISITNNNVAESLPKQKRTNEEISYYAEMLADKLDDRKSLSFYKVMCNQYEPTLLLKKAAEIIADGGARNPGAVFVAWLKNNQNPLKSEHGIKQITL
jgi:hypothetical protein